MTATRKLPVIFAVLLMALPPIASGQASSGKVSFRLSEGDHICLLGNALAERMQHHGWLEARLQSRFSDLNLSFRNLGFSADTLTVQQRTAGFGTWDDYLNRNEADVIFAFFGYVESFAGGTGIDRFKENLSTFIDHTRGQTYNGSTPPRLVLFSPTPFEDLRDPLLPPAAKHNARLGPYVHAMAEVAAQKGVPFVNLFAPLVSTYAGASSLTLNGVHLTEEGNEAVAAVIEESLFGIAPSPEDPARVERVRGAVLEKNLVWFNRYRATDGYNVYGGRSSLAYVDGVTNFDILQQEMAILDATANAIDRKIWGLAQGEELAKPEGEIPPIIPVVTNRPGEGPGGAHIFRDGGDAVAAMTPASGMEVNLFADETLFPELVNPVQMAWDTRGRLWVAVWPTYPHWAPDGEMNDKLLILEDTDGDGQADLCTPFVEDLHNPTGFEFWNGGVLVANPPDLLFLKDTDGDDKADIRQPVLHGLSSGDTHHSANSFVLGPDGALYFQEGVFHQSQVESIYGPVRNHDACVWRFEPRTWRVERYIPYGFANPHGHVFDAWGQDFVTDGTGNVNYFALPFSGHLDPPAKHRGYFPFFQQRSRPCAATEILSSSHFPEENQGNYLIANVIGFQGIFQYQFQDDGSGFSATEVEPIVFSSDPNFRPSDIEIGPDGALYFLDWHNPIIGHMQHHLRDPSRDGDHGRVYRVTVKGQALARPDLIANQPLGELLELLKSPQDRVRYRTRIELSGRDSAEVVTATRTWVRQLDSDQEDHEHHLLEALWLQQQHGVLDVPLLQRLLTATDFRARAAATRVLRQMRHELVQPLSLLKDLATDEHPRVRLEAVVACSFLGSAAAAEVALLALQQPTDRFLDYALGETISALERHWKKALTAGKPLCAGNPAGLEYLLTRLDTGALALVRSNEPTHRERLTRHGLPTANYVDALESLSRLTRHSLADEWLEAISRADQRGDGHADHLLSGLFAALRSLGTNVQRSLAKPLAVLATEGRRGSTRKLATAARIIADGSIDPAWSEAITSVGGLGDLLDAAPLIDDPSLSASLYPKIITLLDALPASLASQIADQKGTRGRYIRIELPGEKRTLTLAEVEVFSDAANVAQAGLASQSSVVWGGVPARALDGNRSGVFADGGQTHCQEDEANPWWEVDLGHEEAIDDIAVWNRTEAEGKWLSRLDRFVLRVLDEKRQTVFTARGLAEPPEVTHFNLSSPSLRIRRAAIRCLSSLGAADEEVLSALAAHFGEEDLRKAVIESFRAIPFPRWPTEIAEALARDLIGLFQQQSEEDFNTDQGREVLGFADELVPHLESGLGKQLATARRYLGPQVIVIRPIPDSLLYDRAEFTVMAGRPVELIFDNTDIMPHNLLLTLPGSLAMVGMAAERMVTTSPSWARRFVPDLKEVLYATRLLQPGESQTLSFEAPSALGDYPYLCTFPGHWIRMNGVMHVVDDWEDLVAEDLVATEAPAAPARGFVRPWTVDELASHLGGVDHASVQRGRQVLEAASCLRCHLVGEEGGRTGPPLAETATRYDRGELLTHLLEPSRVIADGYATEIFIQNDGSVTSGRVVTESDGVLQIQDNPYEEKTVALSLGTLAERRTSEVSTMPEGLMATFEEIEILDLLAYLESLASESSED